MIAKVNLTNVHDPQLSMLLLMRNNFGVEYNLLYIVNFTLIISIVTTLTSTIDSYLSVATTVLSKVFDRKRWGIYNDETTKDKSKVKGNLINNLRMSSALLGVFALFISMSTPNIVNLVIGATSSILIFLPVTLFAIFSKLNIKEIIPITSIVLGYIVLAIFGVFVNIKIAFIPATIISTFFFFIGVYLFKKKII